VTTPPSHVIVDASVATYVGDPPRHPGSAACLSLVRLLAGKGCATGAVMTPALQAEWRAHAPALMVSWLASMESRGRIRREQDKNVSDLRAAVANVADDGIRAAMEKDLHLSEAAILHRVPVASHDNRQRRYLAALVATYGTAGRIQWFSPISDDPDQWFPWIETGCSDADVFRVAAA
jgi:hypothetical protein